MAFTISFMLPKHRDRWVAFGFWDIPKIIFIISDIPGHLSTKLAFND